ncbi:MAG TPA: hypothetical protein VF060_16930 [Trebonia sp.]
MKAAIVIMYIWTALGTGAVGFRRASGVSDDQHRAQEAAEAALRNGQAKTAYVERVYTAIATPALSLCYVRTGTGWQARLGQAGLVEWKPFTTPRQPTSAEISAVEATSVAMSAVMAAAEQHQQPMTGIAEQRVSREGADA